jgi:monoterpene epsilon-lactone hydrolase
MPSSELKQVVQAYKSMGDSLEHATTIEESRAGLEKLAASYPPPPAAQSLPALADGIKAQWIFMPGASAESVVMYLHGGGYAIGSLDTHRGLMARLSQASSARVLGVDYRLAPEHPFPAAVDDAVTAYRWLLGKGVKPSRIVLAGDSAGGGLTVSTLVALRSAKVALPAAAVCFSPWVDLEATGETYTSRASVDPVVTADVVKQMAAMYLGDRDRRTPLAAPLHANLSGLPPILIQVGDAEVLLDDSVRLARRATAAGVKVTLDIWPEMVHVWQLFAPLLPEAQQAIDKAGRFVAQHMA